MKTSDNVLFAGGDIGEFFERNLEFVREAVDQISKDQLLSTPAEDLVPHLWDQLSIAPIELHEDRSERIRLEVELSDRFVRPNSRKDKKTTSVPGLKTAIQIPFSGDSSLWQLKPNSWKSIFPRGDISSSPEEKFGILTITFLTPLQGLNEERLSKEIERELNLIRFYVESSHSRVENHNHQLGKSIESEIGLLKEQASSAKEEPSSNGSHASLVALVGKTKVSQPEGEEVNLALRPSPKSDPPLDEARESPVSFDEDVYEQTLATIRHELSIFEAINKTFSAFGEDDFRDVLLAQLKSHSGSGASEQPFKRVGKTSIRLTEKNGIAFAADCKFWSGPRGLNSTLDQLLANSGRQDGKAALIIFNKSVKGFMGIIDKCGQLLLTHPLCKEEIRVDQDKPEWRFRYQLPADETSEIVVHVFIVNLYPGKPASKPLK